MLFVIFLLIILDLVLSVYVFNVVIELNDRVKGMEDYLYEFSEEEES